MGKAILEPNPPRGNLTPVIGPPYDPPRKPANRWTNAFCLAGVTGTRSSSRSARERVIALASGRHHAWLRARGAVPVAYGDGVSECIIAAAEGAPVVAFIDLVGGGYVELALELGIARDRIDTIVDYPGWWAVAWPARTWERPVSSSGPSWDSRSETMTSPFAATPHSAPISRRT